MGLISLSGYQIEENIHRASKIPDLNQRLGLVMKSPTYLTLKPRLGLVMRGSTYLTLNPRLKLGMKGPT